MSNSTQDVVDFLDQILEQERTALLTGDIEHVGRLSEHKEVLIDELNKLDNVEVAQFSELSAKVERNQLLLTAAQEGIQTVSRRLATMRRIRSSLDTYDAQGSRKNIDIHHKRAVEKRA